MAGPPICLPASNSAAWSDRNELAEQEVGQRAELGKALRMLAVHQEITRVLAESMTLAAATPRIVRAICEGTGWDVGAIWNVDRGAGVLRCVDVWPLPTVEAASLELRAWQITFARGAGLPGRVWADDAPVWIADVARDHRFSPAWTAREHGFHGALALPLRGRGELIGVMELYSREVREPEDDLLRMLDALSSQIGQFTARKRTEAALRESEERYALAARGANDGLWDWDLRTGHIYFSARWKYMLGCAEDEIEGSPDEWLGRIHPDDREGLKAAIDAHLEGQVPHFEHESRIRHKDGTYRWMLSRGLAVRDAEKRATRIAGSQTDITERKMAEERLIHKACHDTLTGLRNRALFVDHLGRSLQRARHGGDYAFAVLFLDLDRFKVINDSLGHMVGDQLLTEIARRLEACLRPGDAIARLGGDEFAILLTNVRTSSGAMRVAQRIHKKLAQPFRLNGQEVFTSASIGIALSAPHYDRADDLLRDADMAMYRAKSRGKARHEMFDAEMHTHAVSILQLESDLRRAVERQEFLIHYQPIVSLASGQMTGVEALLRWQHPQRGVIGPAEFISLAEETGLIVPIGEWLLRTACAQSRAWEAAGHPPLRTLVNLSARQFQDQCILELIRNVLRETGMAAESLQLEITESVAMKNVDLSRATLTSLQTMGVQISIDDFGSGCSSLSYLKRFPLNTLKIDQTFVQNITTDSDDATITAAITALAHSLDLKVIAEGVETEEQLAFLRWQQCDEIQGHLFSPPLPAEQFTQLLHEGRCLPRGGSAKDCAPIASLIAVENWL